MKIIYILALVGSFFVAANAIDLTIFKNEIDPNCLNRLYDSEINTQGLRPLANSMENFISMVETIERNHTNWDIYKISKVLLKRFAFDGIIFTMAGPVRTPQQEQHSSIRSEIIDKVLPFRKEEQDVFDEKDLSEEEKCSMFFMLSHLMNDTYIKGDEELEVKQEGDPQAHGHTFGNNAKKTKFPREQGVVSLNGHPHHAIALGKVLLGIVAAQKQSENQDIGSLFDYLKAKHENFDNNLRMNPLYAVTLGDVVAHAALSAGHDTTEYGIGGHWNNSACTTVYKMSQHTYGTTRALVAGAIDGVLIGKRLASMNGNSRTLTLSKVLRMYYSRDGIPLENSGTPISFCRRNDFQSSTGSNDLLESIKAFYHVYYTKEFQTVSTDTDDKASQSFSKLESIVGGQMNTDEQFCRIQSSDKVKCQTRSNIFFVLDGSESKTEGFHLQEQTIGFLSNYFDIGYGGSTLSVLSNSADGNFLRKISNRSFNATNKAAATCAISRLDSNRNGFSFGQSVDEDVLLKALNGTLLEFEQRVSEEPYAPSKVVVLFKYSGLKLNDEQRIQRAADSLRYGHRDTRVIAVGDNADDLKKLSTNVGDVISNIDRPEEIATKLASMICEVPSVLQYNECYNRRTRNEQNNVHVGYVTPDYTQYIAMYPEYFLKSRRIQFKFNTEGLFGDVQVCFSRTDINPKANVQNGPTCKTSGVDGQRDLIFDMNDPCHKHHVGNCNPAYFSITGIKKSTDKARCTDEACRRLDQIKYTFSHEGVYCSGCLGLMSSSYTVFVLFSIFLVKVLKNW